MDSYYGSAVQTPEDFLKLNFNQAEVQNFFTMLQQFNMAGKQMTAMKLQQFFGYTPEQAKRLMYMYSIYSGRKIVNSSDQTYSKHLRAINGKDYRITINDLATSKISSVPRVAVVSNITQEPFTIWNSNQYRGMNALYKVVDVTGHKIIVETNRKPVLAYKQDKEVPGILEIKGIKQNGEVVVAFTDKVARLCNRYIIIASTRAPETHFGMYDVICFEGTKIHIYATELNGRKDQIKYSMGTQRVYAYGIDKGEIKTKLEKVAMWIYNQLHGQKAEYIPANAEFNLISVVKQVDYTDDLIDD